MWLSDQIETGPVAPDSAYIEVFDGNHAAFGTPDRLTRVRKPGLLLVEALPANRAALPFPELKQEIFRQDCSKRNEPQLATRFPRKPDLKITVFAMIASLLGPQAPAELMQKATFGIPDGLSGYQAKVKKAFDGFEDSLILDFSPSPGVHIPLGYLPPRGEKPVLVCSPGAGAYLDGYREFITAAHQKGYGVLGYQYALLDANGQHISRSGISFTGLESRFRENLNQVSTALNEGQFAQGNGETVFVPKISFKRQILLGHSLGGINSASLVAGHEERQYPALILIASPPSLAGAVRNIVKKEAYFPFQWLLPKRRLSKPFSGVWELTEILPTLKTPFLYIEGTQDGVVREDGWRLYQKAGDPAACKQFSYVAGANHNNIIHGQATYSARVTELINQFLEKAAQINSVSAKSADITDSQLP